MILAQDCARETGFAVEYAVLHQLCSHVGAVKRCACPDSATVA
jgi:hypothetical protein